MLPRAQVCQGKSTFIGFRDMHNRCSCNCHDGDLLTNAQVLSSLPGGIGIMGVYLFSPTSATSQSTLRDLLFSACGSDLARKIHLCLSGDEATRAYNLDPWNEESNQQRAAAHFCSSSKKVTAKCYNVADEKVSLSLFLRKLICSQSSQSAGIWSYRPFAGKLHYINTNISIDALLPVNASSKPRSLSSLCESSCPV